MRSMARTVALGTALLVGIALTADRNSAQAFQKEEEKAQKEILAMAKMLAEGKDISDKVAAYKKKYEELMTTMHSYKPGNKGGIGFGPKGEGIEIKLNNMEKRALPAAQLKSQRDDLIRMAYINAVIADIAAHYAPAKPKGGKGAKEWKQYTTDQKKAAMELIAAVKAGSADKVKTAAKNINVACNDCHRDFRD